MKKIGLVLCFLFIFTGCYFNVSDLEEYLGSSDSIKVPSVTTPGATTPTVATSSSIVLNKYYVDAREFNNPRLEYERYEDYDGGVHKSIPTAYLKFLNNEDVELNYACTGEDMCVTKTTYSTYQENGVTYIKLYEKLGGKHSAEELFFLCSEEGSGYALLKVNGNTISVISKQQGFIGLDLTETTDYKLYN